MEAKLVFGYKPIGPRKHSNQGEQNKINAETHFKAASFGRLNSR